MNGILKIGLWVASGIAIACGVYEYCQRQRRLETFAEDDAWPDEAATEIPQEDNPEGPVAEVPDENPDADHDQSCGNV